MEINRVLVVALSMGDLFIMLKIQISNYANNKYSILINKIDFKLKIRESPVYSLFKWMEYHNVSSLGRFLKSKLESCNTLPLSDFSDSGSN